ncbi:MAG: hypothetical protein HC896_00710 [Bacteroidales bacterium]|nr:hypothetical protein [Bacteroidales bacterium]
MLKEHKHIISWIGITLYMVIALSFTSKKSGQLLCNGIEVNILDSAKNRFVSALDITDVLEVNHKPVLGYPLREINTLEIEKIIENQVVVKRTEAYKNIHGKLCIDIVQREPVIRVIDYRGNSYYIDKEGFIVPIFKKYASHVVVANGYIPAVMASNYRGHSKTSPPAGPRTFRCWKIYTT